MTQVKYTKNELRLQQKKLEQLEKYLPTLQLKKALLQSQISLANDEYNSLMEKKADAICASKIALSTMHSVNVKLLVFVAAASSVDVVTENIAGIEVEYAKEIFFNDITHMHHLLPYWSDGVIRVLREVAKLKTLTLFAKRRAGLLVKELQDVSVRVNLFEKRLIPESKTTIKKIKVFLGDQQLTAVAQAKVAKRKIHRKKERLV